MATFSLLFLSSGHHSHFTFHLHAGDGQNCPCYPAPEEWSKGRTDTKKRRQSRKGQERWKTTGQIGQIDKGHLVFGAPPGQPGGLGRECSGVRQRSCTVTHHLCINFGDLWLMEQVFALKWTTTFPNLLLLFPGSFEFGQMSPALVPGIHSSLCCYRQIQTTSVKRTVPDKDKGAGGPVSNVNRPGFRLPPRQTLSLAERTTAAAAITGWKSHDKNYWCRQTPLFILAGHFIRFGNTGWFKKWVKSPARIYQCLINIVGFFQYHN